MTNIPVQLPGYQIVRVIEEGTDTGVYRAKCLDTNNPVVIKLMRSEYPSFSELIQFHNQYAITQNLNLPGIVRPLALKNYRNGYALIMPDEGYISLKKWMQHCPVIAIPDFLHIAIQLANILYGLYQNQVIHKDIKPANILIHPKTQHVKLIDFSIATLLPKETQHVQSPSILEGTLAYISPEQTGRMNRGIDYRSDFYSLGVTFYELLSGELPFNSNNPMELVHCHIAKMAPVLRRGDGGTGGRGEIPQVLSDIVMKLMAKNAEDRYQSALGLKYDLEKCLKQWQETGTIEPFTLGEKDACDRFIIPEKLYGREAEVAQLLVAFDRVSQVQSTVKARGRRQEAEGKIDCNLSPSLPLSVSPRHQKVSPSSPTLSRSELVLVAGYSGVGKTAVVNEVHKPIVRQRGYFIKGKFDQFNRNIPLSAFVQAFRTLIEQLLCESTTQLEKWKVQILNALGENAGVVLEVIPELEGIIGKQPLGIEFSGNAAQKRFNHLLCQFIQIFTTPEHPLVIFLDDLQWADLASLQLMQSLMSESEKGYLLLIGAYRDNEVFSNHPLMLTVEKIQALGTPVTTITLTPLGVTDINHLIADTLSCSLARSQNLTKLVYQKTQGNPFFVTQFLKRLYEDYLIAFNPPSTSALIQGNMGGWQCDLARVKQFALTENVVEFMAIRLQKLPQATQRVLTLAACIGNQFDLAILAIVSEQSQQEVAMTLWQALKEEFVLPQSEVYKFYQSGESCCSMSVADNQLPHYQFLHDRVQQAAYTLIPDDQKALTHFKIGQLLLSQWDQEEQEKNIFTLVRHINLGCEWEESPLENEVAIRLNLLAGQRAKLSAAYESAATYLRQGVVRLQPNLWQSCYLLSFELYLEMMQVEYFNGRYQEAEVLANRAIARTQTNFEKAKVYSFLVQLFNAKNLMSEAIESGFLALKLLGIDLDNDNLEERFKFKLPEVDDVGNCPILTDRKYLMALNILTNLCTPTYTKDTRLYQRVFLKMIEIGQKYGYSPPVAHGYISYGLFLCAQQGNFELGYQTGLIALKILEKFNAKNISTKINLLFHGQILHGKKHIKETISPLTEEIYVGIEFQELEFASYCIDFLCLHIFRAKDRLKLIIEEQSKIIQTKLIKDKDKGFPLYYARIWHQVALNLSGQGQDPTQLSGSAFEEETIFPILKKSNGRVSLTAAYTAKTILFYWFGRDREALEFATRAADYASKLCSTLAPLHNFYYSLSLLSCAGEFEQKSLQENLEQVEENQKKFKTWSNSAPMNYQHLYELVEAERYRVLNQKVKAANTYDRAIELARDNEYIQDVALAYELTAKFYLNWSKKIIAQTYLTQAYYSYARWGAKAKVEYLEQHYRNLLQPVFAKDSTPLVPLGRTLTQSTTKTSSNTKASELDFTAVLKASQVLSREIDLTQLLTTLMKLVIENAGAQKGVLLIAKNDTWVMEAKITNESKSIERFHSFPLDSTEDLPLSTLYHVAHNKTPLVLENAATEVLFAADPYIVRYQPKSLLCLPIANQGKLVGILYLENNLTVGVFTKERLEVLQLLASQAAISLENARLYEQLKDYSHQLELKVAERTAELEQANRELYRMANLDGLTLVSNRRRFDDYLNEQWQCLLKAKQPLSLVLCDIDYFKFYNDHYHHQAGDECLKQVAQLLEEVAKRPDDLVARYGGEEFAIILPNTDVGGATQVAQGIGEQTQQLHLPHEKSPIAPYITLSVGVSSVVPHPDTSWKTLIATADRALYKAKELGRDRFCIYGQY
ncbi:diguanylate cyclase domain-containing protein [Lusitaniella coriacea]|uniref:diguanylate cyclase domain-containing protein n=1 Tax=Lusitaniella coriacea TaxID=1983105 RepID=UPI003CED4FDE